LNLMLSRRLFLLLALGWMVFLFYLSHQPGIDAPMLFAHQDKVFHAGVYGVLGMLLLAALPRDSAGYSWRQVRISTVIASLYGISDELHQSFVPGRSTEVWDWMADTVGALAAASLLAWLTKKRQRVQQRAEP